MQAQALVERGWIEAAVALLDPHLETDRDAALLRFQLAERLNDYDALLAVLNEDVLARLPWSTRDRAHLLMAQRQVAAGRIESAKVHLDLVFPDAEVYPASRLLVGDLEAADGHYRAAVHAWREAVLGGETGAGLLRIAEVYEKLGRPANAVTYLEMIPKEASSWGRSRLPLARDLLAIGAEGEAMALLIDLGEPEIQAELWTPELAFLRAEAWSQRCRRDRAQEIRNGAVVALKPVLDQLIYELEQNYTPEQAWEAHFGHRSINGPPKGSLPEAWYRTFLDGDDVRPLVERLLRVDRELVNVALTGDDTLVAALAARRAMTIRGLGLRLLVALERARDRLVPWVQGKAESERLVLLLPEDERPKRTSQTPRGRRYRGEFWRTAAPASPAACSTQTTP